MFTDYLITRSDIKNFQSDYEWKKKKRFFVSPFRFLNEINNESYPIRKREGIEFKKGKMKSFRREVTEV